MGGEEGAREEAGRAPVLLKSCLLASALACLTRRLQLGGGRGGPNLFGWLFVSVDGVFSTKRDMRNATAGEGGQFLETLLRTTRKPSTSDLKDLWPPSPATGRPMPRLCRLARSIRARGGAPEGAFRLRKQRASVISLIPRAMVRLPCHG